jgi:hypothetical protein
MAPANANGKPHRFREYRAARRHGEALISPSLDQVAKLIRDNLELQSSHDGLAGLRRDARKLLLEDALRYTSSYRNVDWFDLSAASEQSILMAGHQPAIFHAGVWFKNFALSHLARNHSAVGINLVIDNDVASGSSIRVPTIDAASGRAVYRWVPYDRAGGGVPYEQTTIDDRGLFDSFDQRVCEVLAPLESNPCVSQLWKYARIAVERCGIAGCALAQARHGLEGELGLRTLELPLGVLCRTPVFCEFVLMILAELPRFQRCYNDAAQCYRRAHHIRSSSHPVPDLNEEDDWFEAPLWIYSNDSPKRRAAWVRLSNDELTLSDRAGREVRVDIRYPKLAAEKLSSRIGPNFKLRPRALLTTMYARLVLSDLFMHGIGGGKYDQLGDLIMGSFFMITPPKFMVISATVLLPGPEPVSPAHRTEQLQRMIRDTTYCPEVFADRFELDAELLRQKRELLAAIPERGERRGWHRQMESLNRSIAKPLQEFRQELRGELASMRLDAASHAVLTSREHPFCVFPLEHLTDTYRRLLA